MAWIYDPLRQFYVRPASFIKYVQRWANQQDEALAVIGAAVKSTTPSHTLDSRNDGTSASGSGATNLSYLDDGKAASGANSRVEHGGQGFDTLPSLLEALSTRSITGNASMGAILQFMDRFCGPTGSTRSSFEAINSSSQAGSYSHTLATLLSTPRSKLFLKILGRNLKTGCSVGTIREVYPTLIPGFHVALGQMLKLDEAEVLFELPNSSQEESTEKTNSGKKTKKRKTKETISDLSATTSPNNINVAEWLGSRKLDGVRCLMRIDRRTGNITALSRAGKEFDGMGKILDSLRTIVTMGQSGDDDIQGRDEFFRQALGVHDSDDKKSLLPDALILDGEMCVFVAEPIQETSTTTNGNSQSSPLIIGLLEDDGLGREIFTKAITFVTRGAIEDPFMDNLDNEDVTYSTDDPTASATTTSTDGSEDIILEYDRPLYCIFDCLTDKEFKDRQGTRPLLERIHGLTRALIQSEGVVRDSGGLIKVLCQTKVESYEQLQKMVARGVERGWEGVMLRKNTGYEGKRSRNLLKLKQFHEAEFTVEEAMLGTMRLPLRREFEERDNVLTSVVVVHRGNRVRVGSGFSAEERIRFGRDPSLIVGKTITVKYFEESKTYSGSTTGGGSGGIDDETSSATSERMFSGGGGGATRAKSSITADNTDDEGDDRGDRGGDIIWSLRFPTVKAIYGQGPRLL
ncbi:hypothetical protein BGX24_010717 [Mortierella sp. AD032]|nr:hypothetical protein BGX24_010717 [Mortierella sp. AD032]